MGTSHEVLVCRRHALRCRYSDGSWTTEDLKEQECVIAEPPQIYDEVYAKAMDFLDGEDLDLQIEGDARIEREIKKPDTDGH